MLVWGAHDAVIPYAHARIAYAAMPGSRLETFEDAGHFPHHTDETRFLNVLRDFLATTAPASFSSEEWRELLRRGRAKAPAGTERTLTDETLAGSVRSGT